MHIGIVAEHNIKAEPHKDKQDRPYPFHYVWVRKIWAATPRNPDPVTAHPIPVFIDRQHKGAQDWEPLPVGTRVLVGEVDKSPLNPEGLAVIAIGPQTDEILSDVRETSHYRSWPDGGIDRAVVAPSDPVAGPNADHGRTHLDGQGMGYITQDPYPDDPTRRQMLQQIPGITVTFDHRTDNSTWVYQINVAGSPTIFDLILDAVAGTATLKDQKGNQVVLDSLGDSILAEALAQVEAKAPNILLTAEAQVTVTAPKVVVASPDVHLGGEGGPAVARIGDEVTVSGVTSDGATFTEAKGTITAGSGIVKAS